MITIKIEDNVTPVVECDPPGKIDELQPYFVEKATGKLLTEEDMIGLIVSDSRLRSDGVVFALDGCVILMDRCGNGAQVDPAIYDLRIATTLDEYFRLFPAAKEAWDDWQKRLKDMKNREEKQMADIKLGPSPESDARFAEERETARREIAGKALPAFKKEPDTYALTVRCTNCVPDGKPWQIEIPMGQLWQDFKPCASGFLNSRKAGYGPPDRFDPAIIDQTELFQVFCPYCGCSTVKCANKPLEPTVAENATVQEIVFNIVDDISSETFASFRTIVAAGMSILLDRPHKRITVFDKEAAVMLRRILADNQIGFAEEVPHGE